jgi:hypothetical protein
MAAFTAAVAAGIGFEQLNFTSKALMGGQQWQLKTT